MPISIIPYQESYARKIADLFHTSIHAIDPLIYTYSQQEAWAPTPPDYDMWIHKLARTKPFLATVDETIVGFIELEDDGHIDCAYTHPSYQRQGVMNTLYQYLEKSARQKGLKRLYVEASHLIKPFFEQKGFSLLHQNEVVRNHMILVNYSMEKRLK